MIIDKSQISGTRFMFAIAFYLQSSALLTSFIAGVSEQESWIPVLFGILLSLPIIYMFRTFMVKFPDKNFLQVLEMTYGKVIGKIIGATYVWFFINVTSLNLLDLGDFTKLAILRQTPPILVTLLFILISVWAVRHGFNVVARYSSIFTIIEFSIVILSLILLANQIDLNNLLPAFQMPFYKYVQSTHIITTIPLGELVVFLMVTPCVKTISKQQATKYWFLGALMGFIVLLLVLIRDIAVLGNNLHLFTLPGMVSLRLVNLGEALSRIEIIFAVGLTLLLFFKITILLYVSTIAVAQLFGTTQYKNLALIIGIFVVFYSPTLYQNSVEHSNSARTIEPFVNGLFEVILPLLTLIIASILKLPKNKKNMLQKQEA